MIDSFGRNISYLRVSVTQRCDLNCVYCGKTAPDGKELTAEQIITAVGVFARLGITKVRLTGGEPLVRNDITEIAAGIKKTGGIEKLAITTNGVKLSEKAAELKKAGVDAVNISLDTLNGDCFRRITGTDALGRVLDGIRAAAEQGFSPVRINSVLIRGENDAEAGKLIALAKEHPVDVRFIELMPFSDAGYNAGLVVKAEELLERFPELTPCPGAEDGSAAKYYTAPGFKGKVGFISPVSRKFCADCNRMRLLADGRLRPCLGSEQTLDFMRFYGDEEAMLRAAKDAILAKPAGHNFGVDNMRAMNKIGG